MNYFSENLKYFLDLYCKEVICKENISMLYNIHNLSPELSSGNKPTNLLYDAQYQFYKADIPASIEKLFYGNILPKYPFIEGNNIVFYGVKNFHDSISNIHNILIHKCSVSIAEYLTWRGDLVYNPTASEIFAKTFPARIFSDVELKAHITSEIRIPCYRKNDDELSSYFSNYDVHDPNYTDGVDALSVAGVAFDTWYTSGNNTSKDDPLGVNKFLRTNASTYEKDILGIIMNAAEHPEACSELKIFSKICDSLADYYDYNLELQYPISNTGKLNITKSVIKSHELLARFKQTR